MKRDLFLFSSSTFIQLSKSLIFTFLLILPITFTSSESRETSFIDSDSNSNNGADVVGFLLTGRNHSQRNTNETEAIAFLGEYNEKYGLLLNNYTKADWAYNTNITEGNANASTEAALAVSRYNAEAFEIASQFNTTDFANETKRQLSKVGSKSLTEEKMERLAVLISEMGSIYGEGKVCRPIGDMEEECLGLEPELVVLLAESRNVSERLWAWEGWRKEVGQKIKPKYFEYVSLKNELAVLNGHSDYGDQLRKKYESETFASDIQALYDEMKPLYLQLHAYIRRKLYETYGPTAVNLNGTLPQHLLGDMWGRFWNNLYSIAVPYPDQPALDATAALIEQNYTILKMFQTGEEFFTSMGLQPLPSTFHELSVLQKPNNREVICHPTAWDFYDGKDFRIKMCTKIDFEDFLTIHHELGHVQYFMQYANQPTIYKDGANDGFHEAVGELISMCVSTPKHLETLNLLNTTNIDFKKTEINFLLSMALTSVSTLPFHYLNDLWRWRAFAGEYPNQEDWNEEFWKLSEEIVGVHAPVPRTVDDLDCPTIFHVAQDYDMIRYFTRTILQFQFAESLCAEAGHEGPLSDCDFYNSTAAGTKLADMLQLGSSKPWSDALEALTGERFMQARAIRNYFRPLEEWLALVNYLNEDTPGWTTSSTQSTH